MPMRRRAPRHHQTLAMQGVRQRVHPGNAARSADGFAGRLLLGLLSVWRHRQGNRGMTVMLPSVARPSAALGGATVTLAHGGGGKAMKDLIGDVFVSAFDNPALAPLEDQARFDLAELAAHGDRLAFTTDSFVVSPLIF